MMLNSREDQQLQVGLALLLATFFQTCQPYACWGAAVAAFELPVCPLEGILN